VAASWTGIVVLVGAALALIGNGLPWVKAGDSWSVTEAGYSTSTTDGTLILVLTEPGYSTFDGKLILVLAWLAAVSGILMIVRLGRLWLPIVGLLGGGLLLLIAVANTVEVSTYEVDVHVGAGLWVCVAGGLVLLVGHLLGLVVRKPL
jgi:hypothetical protein